MDDHSSTVYLHTAKASLAGLHYVPLFASLLSVLDLVQ